jgi:hypothetical protein
MVEVMKNNTCSVAEEDFLNSLKVFLVVHPDL